MRDETVPPPGAKTPGFSVCLPRDSRQAVLRTAAGLAAAALGAFGGFQLIQSRARPAAVPVATAAAATSKAHTASLANLVAEKEGRIRRDIFFSNFAEARLPDFGVTELSTADKARFAMWHAQINAPEQIVSVPQTGRRYVSAEWVARISEKYLGDGAGGTAPSYLPPAVTPGNAVPFARVESWKRLPGGKNDRYTATVRVYEPPADWKPDPYTWTMSASPAPDEPRLLGRWTATVRRVPGGYDPPFRYVLISWKRLHYAAEN